MNNIISFKNYNRRKGDICMPDIEKNRKIQIENIVEKLISNLDFSETPSVDIVSLVKRDNFLVQTAELPMDTTGYLIVNDEEYVDEDKKFHRLIMINKKFKNPDNEENVVLKKSRFITAHEYGHFILHRKPNEKLYAHRDSDKRDTPMEVEADYFARSILMPAKSFMRTNDLIDEILNKTMAKNDNIQKDVCNKFKIEFLSKYFKVTKAKVLKRMEDIDVLTSMISQ